jgi:hypothetical protein
VAKDELRICVRSARSVLSLVAQSRGPNGLVPNRGSGPAGISLPGCKHVAGGMALIAAARVRHLENGIAVEFTRLQHSDFLEDNVTGG